MRRRRLYLTGIALVTLLGGATAAPSLAGTTSASIPISGHWYNAGPCLFTGVVPHLATPERADVTCDGSSVWTGSWKGITEFAVTAHGNLVTSQYDGTLAEIFVGTMGRRHGTMTFHENFHLANGHVRIVATLVSASGGFAGSQASVVFTGIVTPATNGFGSYHGTWQPGS